MLTLPAKEKKITSFEVKVTDAVLGITQSVTQNDIKFWEKA